MESLANEEGRSKAILVIELLILDLFERMNAEKPLRHKVVDVISEPHAYRKVV